MIDEVFAVDGVPVGILAVRVDIKTSVMVVVIPLLVRVVVE